MPHLIKHRQDDGQFRGVPLAIPAIGLDTGDGLPAVRVSARRGHGNKATPWPLSGLRNSMSITPALSVDPIGPRSGGGRAGY